MKKLLTLLLFVFFFISASPISAFKQETFTNWVFPVRHLYHSPDKTLSLTREIYQEATKSATPITWLLDYDLLLSASDSAYFVTLRADTTQEIGLLLEATPKLRADASTDSPRHSSISTLLNSYTPKDRTAIIDQAFKKYFEIFGHYPRSVGTDYLDSFSLEYLAARYSVFSAIFNISTPGQPAAEITLPFTHFPYFPSKINALSPAQSKSQKIPIAITTFNPPSLNAYLSGGLFSTPLADIYEKLNPYLSDLATPLINDFQQLSLGFSNELSASLVLPYFLAIEDTFHAPNIFNMHPSRLGDFGFWFNQRYPHTQPGYFFRSTPTATTYYSTPFYQLALSRNQIDHLTVFNPTEPEPYRQQHNIDPKLTLSTYPLLIDTPIDLNFDLNNLIVSKNRETWEVVLKEGEQTLLFNAQKVVFPTTFSLPPHPAYTLKAKTLFLNSDWAPYLFSLRQILTPLLPLLLLLFLLFALRPSLFKSFRRFVSRNFFILAVIGLASFVWSLTMLSSARYSTFGLRFFGVHNHDAMFHLSLIESFKDRLWPLVNPNLVGSSIYNYHLFYDYLLALISRLSGISPFILYFYLVPPVIAFGIGFFAFRLLTYWRYSRASIIFSLLTLYLVGSLGFIQTLLTQGVLFGGESVFWANQAVTTLVNPPLALSYLFLLLILYLFSVWSNTLNLRRILILSLLIALLIQIKAYAFVLLFPSLALFVLINRQNKTLFRPLILLLLISLTLAVIFFLPTYLPGNSLFVFRPFWFLRSLFAAQDRLYLPYLATAWQNSLYTSNYLKLLVLHLLAFAVFVIGNFGIRLISLPAIFKSLSLKDTRFLAATIIILGFLVPLVFIQSGNSWNSLQFMYYSLFLSCLFIGPPLKTLLNRSRNLFQLLFIVGLVLLLTLPTTIGSLKNYTTYSPSSFISSPELRVLEVLSRQPDGLVLAPVFYEPAARPFPSPKPLFASESTAYITAFSGKPVYFADEVNLDIMGYNYQKQKVANQRFFLSEDPNFIKDFLLTNKIDYLYLNPLARPKLLDGLAPLFDAGAFKLYTKPNQ